MKSSHLILALVFLQASAPWASAQAVVEYVGMNAAVARNAPAAANCARSVANAAVEKLLAQPQTVSFGTEKDKGASASATTTGATKKQ